MRGIYGRTMFQVLFWYFRWLADVYCHIVLQMWMSVFSFYFVLSFILYHITLGTLYCIILLYLFVGVRYSKL